MTEHRRSYHQFCGLARSLDVVGERWTLLVVRELLYGPKRYSDFLEALPGLTTNLLAKRLTEMAEVGLLEQRALPRPGRGKVYELTELGLSLEPALMELARFGGNFMKERAPDDTANIAWALLSLKRRYRRDTQLTASLTVGGPHPVGDPNQERSFELSFEPGYLRVLEKQSDHADFDLQGDLSAFRDWLLQGVGVGELLSKERLTLTGPKRALGQLVKALALPR